MNSIKFTITNTQYILLAPEPLKDDCCETCSYSCIYYIDEELGLNIPFGYTESDNFQGSFGWKSIQPLFKNKRFFDSDKRKDPGFELNQYYAGLIKKSDVVEKYHFVDNNPLGTHPQCSSWLYNDKDGNIIFEISPTYEFFGIRKQDNPNFISYKKFIQNYKVLVHKIIPKETLMLWDMQTKNYIHDC